MSLEARCLCTFMILCSCGDGACCIIGAREGDSVGTTAAGAAAAGKLVVEMKEGGNREVFVAGDAFHIPPNHDAYVEGDEEVRR